MPVDAAAAVIGRLPEEVVAALRELAHETAAYSDEDWNSLIVVNGPQPTDAERKEYRLKCEVLQKHFAATKS